MKEKKILTCGPLLLDFVASVYVPGSEKLDHLITHHNLIESKQEIDREISRDLARALKGRPVVMTPGGSSMNALATLKGMMKDAAHVDFLGMLASGPLGDIIEGAMKDSGLNLINIAPENTPIAPETAVSYVLTPPNGNRKYAVYNGNVKEIAAPEAIPDLEDRVKNTDVVMLSGSAWERVSPAVANTLMDLRWKHGKELVLSLPVGRLFSEREAHNFRWRLHSANVVLANEEELARTYQVDSPEEALKMLQQDFQKKTMEVEKSQGKWSGKTEQVGFVTFGKDGAYIITADEIKKVDPLPDPPGQLFKGGAGDTAFAGFLLGHFNGESHEVSAQIAMELANAKLIHPEPRLPNPEKTLRELMPNVAARVYGGAVHSRVAVHADDNGRVAY